MYPELTGRVLSAFATEAGLAGAASSIQGSKGMVRASWLLRVPGVGFVEQAPFVTQFCVNSFTVHSVSHFASKLVIFRSLNIFVELLF
jgi:hypothetical protein